MKKIIALAIALCTVSMNICVDVKAADMNILPVVAGAGTAAGEALSYAYDASVVSRMAGRCGAATATGSKGIAFEILYTDKKNFENVFKNMGKSLKGKTQFTKSPNAKAIDLITIDQNTGKVLERIQCKATTSVSGTDQVINAVKNGKYNSVQLVGTTEAAEMFNNKAVKESIAKEMKDSGISSKAAERIADKALGNTSKIASIGKSVGKTAGIGGVIDGGFALIESVANGDDAYNTISNVSIESAKGAIAMGTADLVACEAGEIMLALGASELAATAVPIVICIGGAVIIAYVIDGYIEEKDIKEILANNLQQTCETSAEAVCLAEERIGEHIENMGIANIPDKIEDSCITSAEAICTLEERAAEEFESTTGAVVDGVTGLFKQDKTSIASK